jgi:hypothetical protein
MSNYSLFIEQTHYSGASTRPHQRTITINALTDSLAIKEAEDFVEGLFDLNTIHQIRAHLCRADGTVLREIVRSREMVRGAGSA